jgi:hypothetical protein
MLLPSDARAVFAELDRVRAENQRLADLLQREPNWTDYGLGRADCMAAMAARLTPKVRKAAETAQRVAFKTAPTSDFTVMQADGHAAWLGVLLDALTGAGEEEK